ncbi:MAG: DsbA family oxidoreductase [Crocinitomicaceae bacterium]|nr:DsbA family oxidoreductase [Crocinitomicaceae bacterium]
MQIEIWSDVVCPFCYIGKRQLEKALNNFSGSDSVEIVWKSFQLDPDTVSNPEKSSYEYLAERYGKSVEWAIQAHENVVEMARTVGLDFKFDKAKIANTFDAHRLIQFAKKHNRANEMEEVLFRSYFTDGKNIADNSQLIDLAKEIGLNVIEVEKVLNGSDFGNAVRQDFIEAQQLGVRGVPFFVFNRKYAVSGAQPAEEFLKVLEKVESEMQTA